MNKEETCQAKALYQKNAIITAWCKEQQNSGLAAKEFHALEQLSQNCFGYFALQLGIAEDTDTLESFVIDNKLYLASNKQQTTKNNRLYTDPLMLPLDDRSCDVVVIHHLHELVSDPHQLIRESSRIVRDSGHIFIVGTTPEPRGYLHKFFKKKQLWHHRLLQTKRLVDWLQLMGFSDIEVECRGRLLDTVSQKLPATTGFLSWLAQRVPIGRIYCIKAVKHTCIPILTLQQKKRAVSRMLGSAIVR